MKRYTVLLLVSAALLSWGVWALAAVDQQGTLVVALDTLGAQTTDPILETRAPHAHYQAPVYDALVGFDSEKGGIGPGVAERWELAADGGIWVFHLRKGLTWHNGDPLTAQDVKFSLERTMSKESVASRGAALRRWCSGFVASLEHPWYRQTAEGTASEADNPAPRGV